MSVLSANAKKLLIIEAVVGALILIGGIFLMSTKSKAPTVTPHPSTSSGSSTYISSPLQISLEYPYGWQLDPTFNGIAGIERYIGSDGFFEVGATNDPAFAKASAGKATTVIIKKYPKSIKIGETTYRYFTLKADATHLKSIGDSVTFL